MKDLIEREKTLKRLLAMADQTGLITTESVEYVLASEPSAQPEQQWIPCSERLPEDGERVLATHLGGLNPDRQVIEHIYKNGEFTLGWDMDMNKDSPTFGQRYMGKVVAWCELPEPYRGEGEKNDEIQGQIRCADRD